MSTHTLGKTELSVSRIALGCWGFAGGPMWGKQEESDSIATVSAALDSGINFFETAQGYGNGRSEKVLGKALKGCRDQAVVATKIRSADMSAKGIEAACELSLKRLQTDYIDLLQPHWPARNIPAEETYQAFTSLQEKGKIRAFGLSNYGVRDLTEILEYGEVASNQLPYSLMFRAIEYEILPLCLEKNIGVLCYSTLLHGLLAGKFATLADVPDGRARTRHFSKNRPNTRHNEDGCEAEVSVALEQIRQTADDHQMPMQLLAVSWVLQQPGVAAVILGARKPEQIQQMVNVTETHLHQETLRKLNNFTEQAKQCLGPNPDMWMSESRFR